MTAFRAVGAPSEREPRTLAPERLSILQASVHHHARRVANRWVDPSADVADIRQSLLLATLTRLSRFDPERASWSTFVDLLVEHAAWDYTRQRLPHRKYDGGSLDDPARLGVPSPGLEEPDSAFTQAERALDVERAIEELPEHLRRLCRLLQLEPPSVAQRRSGLPQAEFYLGSSASGSMTMALYADDGNEPGDLIAETEEKALSSTSSGHWEEFAFASPPAISPVKYWIACHSSASVNSRGSDGSNQNDRRRFKDQPYANGRPDPFGAASNYNNTRGLKMKVRT